MPTDFRISDLPTSASFENLDLMEVSQVDAQSLSGYTSIKKTMNQLGDKLNNNIEYSASLNTTDKKIIGAINEVFDLCVIPTGSHTVYGSWSSTYYGTCRLWVAFPNANKYTITLTQARYRSADTTMTTLDNATIAATNDCGFLVSAGSNVPINQYGDVTFTTALS